MTELTPKKPKWEKRWLEVFRDTGNVRLSCHAVNISRQAAYQHRDRDPSFAAAWKQAEEDATDVLEAEARKRARNSSDVLLIFLLKSLRPSKYRETVRNEHTGADGGPITVSDVTERRTQILGRMAGLAAIEEEGGGDSGPITG